MSDLLPNNATRFERALEAVTARISDVPTGVREVWNPNTCPEALLPWLAWAFSVDAWDPAWTEEQKRETIRRAVEVQRIKGTVGAVELALGALDIRATILEWHRQDTPGDPYTYQMLIDARSNAATLAAINEAIAIVDGAKSLRSHLEFVQVATGSEVGPVMGAVASVGSEIVVVRYRGEYLSAAGTWDDDLAWDDMKNWGLEL